ncbi:MAG: hypothetical protein ACFFD8_03975 [Candidatus Thorarchaeota archaeon]
MSSNSEYAQGLVLINGQAYPAKDVLQALERQAMTSIRVVSNELWVGKERVRPLAKTSPEQAMKLTCYASLAFCCDLSRECHLRDEALRLIGMPKEEYRAIQNDCHQQFLRFGERRWPHEHAISPSSDFSSSQSYSGRQPKEPYDPWHEPSTQRGFGTRRTTPHEASDSVDLGGLFSEPKEYSSHSLTDSEPFSSFSTRLESDHPTEGWLSPGSTATASPPTHASARGFCIYCGQDLREESEFCNRCGRSQK